MAPSVPYRGYYRMPLSGPGTDQFMECMEFRIEEDFVDHYAMENIQSAHLLDSSTLRGRCSSHRESQLSERGCRVRASRLLPLFLIVVVVAMFSCTSPGSAGGLAKQRQRRGIHSVAKAALHSDIAGKSEVKTRGNQEARRSSAEGAGPGEQRRRGKRDAVIEGTEGAAESEAAEEQEELDEAEWTGTDVQVASMLMGASFFVMVLLWITNWPDDDIRYYAWNTISAVTSIFTAVLMFQLVNETVLHVFRNFSQPQLCAVQYVHLLVWILMLQFVLAYVSGTICEDADHGLNNEYWVLDDYLRADVNTRIHSRLVRNKVATKSFTNEKKVGLEIAVRRALPERENRMNKIKCWGQLFAHMTGFAAINAGGTMQHLELFDSSPLMSTIPILMNQFFINIFFLGFEVIRRKCKESAMKAGRKGERAKLFDEEVRESEIDICCLSWSFLLIQTVRFELVRTLPTMRGETITPSRFIIGMLFVIGTVFGSLAVVVIKLTTRSNGAAGSEDEEEMGPLVRFLAILIGGLSMCFAWCFLFGGRWLYTSFTFFDDIGCGMETVIGRICLALFLCIFVFAFVFLLDAIDDAMKETEEDSSAATKVISQIVMALSVLAGFSWEHAFDGGVEAIASKTAFPLTVEALMGFAVFVVVVPAWRQHILQKYMTLLHRRKHLGAQSTRELAQILKKDEADKLNVTDAHTSDLFVVQNALSQAGKSVDELFVALAKGSGSVHWGDFLTFFIDIEPSLTGQQLQQLWRSFEKDGDGGVTRTEFIQILAHKQAQHE